MTKLHSPITAYYIGFTVFEGSKTIRNKVTITKILAEVHAFQNSEQSSLLYAQPTGFSEGMSMF
ncbi:hypothetical protein NI389_00680 [Pseudoalteromonas xiamenensis]|uniref:hypothetical protein n=1 Tax=Pseudoalteromonas xiamenensis TaxID=882626 RepID=UPI0027E42707|nr:hypothetical protein [Pseudoalteromonas xiamenensis]WMN59979.1 hypothetical protein NI389_00680 [Pseudoalteromonas xiamenensis]